LVPHLVQITPNEFQVEKINFEINASWFCGLRNLYVFFAAKLWGPIVWRYSSSIRFISATIFSSKKLTNRDYIFQVIWFWKPAIVFEYTNYEHEYFYSNPLSDWYRMYTGVACQLQTALMNFRCILRSDNLCFITLRSLR